MGIAISIRSRLRLRLWLRPWRAGRRLAIVVMLCCASAGEQATQRQAGRPETQRNTTQRHARQAANADCRQASAQRGELVGPDYYCRQRLLSR